MKLTRWLWPSQQLALVVLAGALVIGLGVQHVSAVHAARAAKQAVCLAQLRTLRARHLFLERFVMPTDPCAAILIVVETP
jgi:hypothetical protein